MLKDISTRSRPYETTTAKRTTLNKYNSPGDNSDLKKVASNVHLKRKPTLPKQSPPSSESHLVGAASNNYYNTSSTFGLKQAAMKPNRTVNATRRSSI